MARLHELLVSLPDPPPTIDKTFGITDWGMLGNDNAGDCTCAAAGHMIDSWTASAGAPILVGTDCVIAAYSAITGYNPTTGMNDNGAVITDVLNYWMQTGICGHQITAHAEVNITQLRIMQALYLFDAVDVGIELPASAQSQVGSLWDFPDGGPDAAGGWGGHSVPIVYADMYSLKCVTWGALQSMTWRWFEYYCDEAHGCLSPDQTSFPVDMGDLPSDLQQVGA